MNHYELFILGLFSLSLIANYFSHRMHLVHFLFFLVFYTGVEFATEGAWKYNAAFDTSMLTFRNKDVSVSVALAWVSMFGLGLSLGALIAKRLDSIGRSIPLAVIDTLSVAAVGITVEFISVKTGMFTYEKQHFLNTLGMGSGIWVGPLPFTVVLGYFLTGLFVHGVVRTLR